MLLKKAQKPPASPYPPSRFVAAGDVPGKRLLDLADESDQPICFDTFDGNVIYHDDADQLVYDHNDQRVPSQ